MHPGIGALVAAALVAAPCAAWAAPEAPHRLAVLAIIDPGPHGEASLSDLLGAVGEALTLRPTLELISAEEMFVASQDGLAHRVRDCGPDTRCITSRLRAFTARMGLVAVLSFGSEPPLLGLQLLDTDEGVKVGEALSEVEGRGRSALAAHIAKEAGDLFERCGYHLAGRLVIDVVPADAHLVLESGRGPDRGTPNVFTLPAGRYEVAAHHDGFRSGRASAEVVAGAERRVALSLEEIRWTLLRSPWFWVVAGVAAAGAVTGVALALRDPGARLCFTERGVGCDGP